jgi:gliding-associated putative ABC transporter substrate-binding component GldG
MADQDNDQQVSHKRQWISGANAAVVIAATLAIAFVANAIASQFSQLRIDLTENQLYTLSKASKDVVRDLEDRKVTVKAFISADMPAPMHTLRRRVKALLAEYQANSAGNLEYEIYSPGSEKLTDKQSKRIEEDAKGYGCEKVSIGQRGKDQFSLRSVYKCVAFITDGGQKTEVIKDLRGRRGGGSQGNFEYEFTKALMNLVEAKTRKVGFVSGFGGPADRRGFERQVGPVFEQLFGDLVKPTTVDLSGNNPSVPEDVSALVLLNPSKKVSDQAKFALDQFLQEGGSLGWYQSATGISQKMRQQMRRMGARGRMSQFRQPLEPGLREFVSEYGIDLRKDLVLDRGHAITGMVRTQRGPAALSFPATFTTTNIDTSLPFTKDFGTLAFPAPSSLQITAAATENSDVESYEVVNTHESAVRRKGAQTDLSYKNLRNATDDEEAGPFTIAGALQGNIPSFYEDNELPKGVSESDVTTDSSSSSRLLVVGSGNFYQPQQSLAFNQRLASLGGQFFISSIEWLVQDSALAQIRGKSLPRMIDEVPSGVKRTIQFVNIAAVPAFFALIGLVMMYRRRRRRERLKWSDDE